MTWLLKRQNANLNGLNRCITFQSHEINSSIFFLINQRPGRTCPVPNMTLKKPVQTTGTGAKSGVGWGGQDG